MVGMDVMMMVMVCFVAFSVLYSVFAEKNKSKMQQKKDIMEAQKLHLDQQKLNLEMLKLLNTEKIFSAAESSGIDNPTPRPRPRPKRGPSQPALIPVEKHMRLK